MLKQQRPLLATDDTHCFMPLIRMKPRRAARTLMDPQLITRCRRSVSV